jgi:ethanolaminephosphotransferase
MHDAQDILSSAASNYDVKRLFVGTGLAALICILSLFALPSLRPISSSGLYYFLTLVLYAVLMFASSYVEEEHNFWYWITSGWFFLLFLLSTRKSQSSIIILHPALVLLVIHRVIRRWNQTGQKYSGAPDIVTSGVFHGANSLFLWVLIGATYLDVTNRISKHIARSVVTLSNPLYRKQVDPQPLDHHRATGTLIALPLCGTAFVFKLAFTAKDAPELTYAITPSLMAWVEALDLVNLARTVFAGIALVFAWITFAEYQRSVRRAQRNVRGQGGTLTPFDTGRGSANAATDLANAFFDLLTLFLLTQTKSQNVPLYLLFRFQVFFLCKLPSLQSASPPTPPDSRAYTTPAHLNLTPTQTTLTSLLLAQTSFFALGLNNSISSVDLSNAYNGVSGYNVLAVGLLVFLSNWAGPVYWSVAGVLLLGGTGEAKKSKATKGQQGRSWVQEEHAHLATLAGPKAGDGERKSGQGVWARHVSLLTLFTGVMLVSVMAACTALRTHLFIWTVFSPKYLFAMAWGVAWHLGVTIGLGSLVSWLGGW